MFFDMRLTSGSRVGGGDAAVDEQGLAGHERRLVAGEEQGAVGDLDRLAEAAHRHVHEAALALGLVGQELGEQRREHRSGAQRVGPDALAGVDHGDLAGHRQHRTLRRRVGDLRRRRAHVGDERGDVDDAAATGVEHRRDAVPAAAGDAGDVDVEGLRPRLVGRVRRAVVVAGGDAGVVVEHVEAAERLDGERHRGGDAVVVTDVGGDVRGLAARLGDRVDRVVAVGDVGDHHLRALASEELGGDPSEARRGAGDERHLVLQPSRPFRHCIPSVANRPQVEMVWSRTLGRETLAQGNGYGKLRTS